MFFRSFLTLSSKVSETRLPLMNSELSLADFFLSENMAVDYWIESKSELFGFSFGLSSHELLNSLILLEVCRKNSRERGSTSPKK